LYEVCGVAYHNFHLVLTVQNVFLQGFERVYRSMEDLSLDSPHAYQILEAFCNDCRAEDVIGDELREKMPGRLVKRILETT
jgi:hypothetical protein